MTKIKITLPPSGGAIAEFSDGDGNVGYTSFNVGGGGGGEVMTDHFFDISKMVIAFLTGFN